MKRYILFLSLFIVLISSSFAQRARRVANVRDTSIGITMFRPTASANLPIGQLHTRTGFFYSLGGSVINKTASQWLFGVEGYFFNGGIIREKDHLKNLINSSGGITAQDGLNADMNRYYRGWSVMGQFGRLFPVGKPNMNSGFFILFGVGYIQHKIRTEIRQNNVWQLQKPYNKGYDRLSGGFNLSQFVGYQYINNRKTLTFFLGVEMNEGLVKSYRKFNYDTQRPDTDWFYTSSFAVKGGWMFNVYHRKQTKEYYK